MTVQGLNIQLILSSYIFLITLSYSWRHYQIRGVGHDSLLPINLSGLHFRRFFGGVIQCEITRRLSRDFVKSSPRVWILKYCYFKWSSRVNSGGFWIFVFWYTIFQAFRTWKDVFAKLNVNLWKIWRKFKNRQNVSNPPVSNQVDSTAPSISSNKVSWGRPYMNGVGRLCVNLKFSSKLPIGLHVILR